MDPSTKLLGGRYYNEEIEEDVKGEGLCEGLLYNQAEGQT
jgi:hypothetical protein